MPSREPLRVLHVLHCLNQGGVETWLLHVLRNTPPELWSSEFLLHSAEPGAYDEEVRALGGVLHYCTGPRRPAHYSRRLRQILRGCGPYDVVHSHVHLYSGIVLRAAHQEHVPLRIAHSHYAGSEIGSARHFYASLMRGAIRAHATHGLAAAPHAAAALFGANWRESGRVRIHECGLDYSAFGRLPARALLKQQLGLPAGRIVIGHVGRFVPEKNHAFVVATFLEMLRAGVDAHLLLVGTGPLESRVREQVESLGIARRCSMVGSHNDVARFFGAMDMLLFPSLSEGLGVVVLEAQAAALPVLASAAVTTEVCIVPGLVRFRSLADGATAWAGAACDILASAPSMSRVLTAHALNASRYGVAHSVRALAELYGTAASHASRPTHPVLTSTPAGIVS